MRKAVQFVQAANTIRDFADEHSDIADAFVTLCVHASIAASDVLCCLALGVYPQGESHSEAVALLAKTDKDAAKHLSMLLGLKSKSGYTHMPMSVEEFKKAGRAADALVEKARRAQASSA